MRRGVASSTAPLVLVLALVLALVPCSALHERLQGSRAAARAHAQTQTQTQLQAPLMVDHIDASSSAVDSWGESNDWEDRASVRPRTVDHVDYTQPGSSRRQLDTLSELELSARPQPHTYRTAVGARGGVSELEVGARTRQPHASSGEDDLDSLITGQSNKKTAAPLDRELEAALVPEHERYNTVDKPKDKPLTPQQLDIVRYQVTEVKRCFRVLHNLSTPVVLDRLYFPKYKARKWRFRYHCQSFQEASQRDGVHFSSDQQFQAADRSKQDDGEEEEEEEEGGEEGGGEDPNAKDQQKEDDAPKPSFLVSYGIDNTYMPEWVAFVIDRPSFGNSMIAGNTRANCSSSGGAKFFAVNTSQGIVTPDPPYLIPYNTELLKAGKDKRDGVRKGQLCSPTYFLTCEEKQGTYSMLNTVPMNRYLYDMNWRRVDVALRQYVSEVVPPAPKDAQLDPARMQQYLRKSKRFRPINVVMGPHFNAAKVEKFDWDFDNQRLEKEEAKNPVLGSSRRGYLPQAVWGAALDPSKIQSQPELAAIAWYCNNRPTVPWEEAKETDEEEYENGPKLCHVLSLKDLKSTAGVVPFPGLPKAVRNSKPVAAAWRLPGDRF